MRTYAVQIADYPPATYSAATRGKARYQAFLDYSDTCDCTFQKFQKISKVRTCGVPDADGYDYIRRAYNVDVRVGQRVRLQNEGPGYNGLEGEVVYPGSTSQYVYVCLDGRNYTVHVHPHSVEIIDKENQLSQRRTLAF